VRVGAPDVTRMQLTAMAVKETKEHHGGCSMLRVCICVDGCVQCVTRARLIIYIYILSNNYLLSKGIRELAGVHDDV
jgi:hypothetical protein